MQNLFHFRMMTALLCLLMGATALAQSTNWMNKTYTWTDKNGEVQTSKYSDEATDPAQILALLGNLYVDPDVPGFINHIEYKTNGTAATASEQMSQRFVDYDLQARMKYFYRPGSLSGGKRAYRDYNDNATWNDRMRKAEQAYDRASWITKLPGYGSQDSEFSKSQYTYGTADNSTSTGSSRWIKKYNKEIDQPSKEGATVLFVQIKDSWNDEDIRLFMPATIGNYLSGESTLKVVSGSNTRYAGMYYWNAVPNTAINNYWDGSANFYGGYTNSLAYQGTLSRYGTVVNSYRYNSNNNLDNQTIISHDYTDYLYNLDYNFVDQAFESVKLIPNSFYVDDIESDNPNPGYLCIIDEVRTKRFFYVAKGRVRAGNWQPPFYQAWEQLSPTTKDPATGLLIDANKMTKNLLNKTIFDFQHDCQNVLWGDGKYGSTPANDMFAPHYAIIVEDESGQATTLHNLTLFIPEKRFKHLSSDKSGSSYHQIVTDDTTMQNFASRAAVKMFLYLAELNAVATLSATEGYYDIKLDWSTLLNYNKTGSNIAEQFYVYVYDSDNNLVLLDTFIAGNDNYECDAALGERTRLKTYTYRVAILDASQTFTYIVTANPIDPIKEEAGEANPGSGIMVNSNTATVIVPGKDTFVLTPEYRSQYDVDNEQNRYRNTLRVAPNPVVPGDYQNIATAYEYYELYRKTPVGDSTLVATITFTYKDNLGDGDTRRYDYVVVYKTSVPSQVFGDDNASAKRTTTGVLTWNGHLDLFDYFNASTADNDHYDSYTYRLHNKSKRPSSNSFMVPVNKTNNFVEMQPVSYDDVMGDTNHSLENPRVVSATLAAYLDAEVQNFKMHRLSGGTDKTIGKVERQPAGSMMDVTGLDSNFDLAQSMTAIDGSEMQFVDFVDDLESQGVSNPSYVPVITTAIQSLGQERVENTYGCDFRTPSMPSFSMSCSAVNQSDKHVTNEGDKAYKTMVTLTPTVPEGLEGVYMYRVWRVVDGVETLLNGAAMPYNPDPNDAAWIDTLSTFYPSKDESLVFYDYIIHKELKEGESLPVSYIARMYSYVSPPPFDFGVEGAPRREPATPESSSYYMSQATGNTSFAWDIITYVDDIVKDAVPVRVLYYNTLGAAAATPWKGVNIKCQVMSDGSVITRKVIH